MIRTSKTNTKYGDRIIFNVASKHFNSLAPHIKQVQSICNFKKQLKAIIIQRS